MSETEARFERRKQFIGLWLGPLLFVLALLSPPLEQVSPVGMRTLGIFFWTVTWWICEPIPIPITSLFSMAMLVLCGVLTVDAAFINWANWINLFLLGASVIGHAVSVTGLARRIAYRMTSIRLVAGNPWRVLVLFGLGAALMGSVVGHIPTTLIFLSIAVGLARTVQLQQGSRYAEALFLAIGWGASMGIATPVGGSNLLAVGVAQSLGYRIGFLEWIMICLPVFVVSLVALFLVIRYVLQPEMPDWQLSASFLLQESKKLGPLTRGEKITGGVFLGAMLLWMLPDLITLFLPGGRQHPLSMWATRRLDWSVTALMMMTLLFVIPVDWKQRRFVMTWDEAVKGVPWGTLSLVAGALTLGNAFANKELGLGRFLDNSISALVASSGSQIVVVFTVVAFVTIVGAFVSNLVIIAMIGTLAQVIGASAGINPIALVIVGAMAANMDFALPIGTPGNALVFASGYVRIGRMFKGGMVLALLSIPVVTLLGYYMASWVLSWQP